MFSFLFLLVLQKAIPILPVAIAVGSALMAGASYAASHHTNKTNEQIQKSINSFNQRENDKAWERELEKWNLENEYNTPANQIKRLQEAGLSPYLGYGNVSNSAASLSVPTPVSSAGYHYQSPAGAAVSSLAQFAPMILSLASGLTDLETSKEKLKQTRLDTKYLAGTLDSRIGMSNNQLAMSQWNLNNNEYISRMNKLKAQLMETFGMSNAEFESELLRNRAAASTYDKQTAYANMKMAEYSMQHSRLGYEYEKTFGYNGRGDWFNQALVANSTGGAIIHALSGLAKGSGLDAKLMNVVKSLFRGL